MKEIRLTQGKSAIVDDEDYEFLSQYKWHYMKRKDNSPSYAAGCLGHSKHVWMHRVIMNAPNGEFVDHIDGDTLNNQKNNLRLCSHKNNSRNKHKRYESLSKYKGLSKGENRNKWHVQIGVDGKRLSMGTFIDEIEAAKAYDAAARFYYGEFAQTNFDGNLALSAQEIKELPKKSAKPVKPVKPVRARKIRRQRVGETSIYRGVRRESKKWRATIYTASYKKIDLGLFINELDAAHAYDVAAKNLRGKLAQLNFPEPKDNQST